MVVVGGVARRGRGKAGDASKGKAEDGRCGEVVVFGGVGGVGWLRRWMLAVAQQRGREESTKEEQWRKERREVASGWGAQQGCAGGDGDGGGSTMGERERGRKGHEIGKLGELRGRFLGGFGRREGGCRGFLGGGEFRRWCGGRLQCLRGWVVRQGRRRGGGRQGNAREEEESRGKFGGAWWCFWVAEWCWGGGRTVLVMVVVGGVARWGRGKAGDGSKGKAEEGRCGEVVVFGGVGGVGWLRRWMLAVVI
ncbi:uncharacterized protein [Spinacia oleracea]|uniref:Uncharacterized protein n=1 Tax=Spinacia oleracea TaxID=3562 RepID=A0ABM3QZJ7_SPIOL|nr:uncharacterized protein LOC130463638 [Spinacia oleracea]